MERRGRPPLRRRDRALAPARGDGDRRRAAEHAHERDDAPRLGAGGLGRAGADRARRHGRAAPVARDPAPARPGRGRRPHRRLGHARALRDPRGRAQRLLRGGGAAPAREAREGPGERRRAAARVRPPGVPALARRAPVGPAGARPARRHRRPPDRRLDRVGRPALPVPAPGRAVRAHRGVGHRLGADVALAVPARVAVAGHRRRAHDPRHGDARAGAPAAGLAPLTARPRRHRPRARRGGAPRGDCARRRADPVPARRRAAAERRALGRARPLHARPACTRPPCSPSPARKESGRPGGRTLR